MHIPLVDRFTQTKALQNAREAATALAQERVTWGEVQQLLEPDRDEAVEWR